MALEAPSVRNLLTCHWSDLNFIRNLLGAAVLDPVLQFKLPLHLPLRMKLIYLNLTRRPLFPEVNFLLVCNLGTSVVEVEAIIGEEFLIAFAAHSGDVFDGHLDLVADFKGLGLNLILDFFFFLSPE